MLTDFDNNHTTKCIQSFVLVSKIDSVRCHISYMLQSIGVLLSNFWGFSKKASQSHEPSYQPPRQLTQMEFVCANLISQFASRNWYSYIDQPLLLHYRQSFWILRIFSNLIYLQKSKAKLSRQKLIIIIRYSGW